jgi:ribonucleoside-diphosphate reductase subunit M1
MFVIKRDNSEEKVSFDKVLQRLEKLSDGLDENISIEEIAQKVCSRIHNKIHTYELDIFASQLCSSLISVHPDYGKMAARLMISNHQKRTSPSFSETITTLYQNFDKTNNIKNPLVSEELYDIVMYNRNKLNSYIDYTRDYLFDYFGFKTLEKSYLLKVNGIPVERPQDMFMRVSLGIHGVDLKDALETYDMMSQRYFTHASPTLFNAGTPRQQMSSCFLLDMEDSLKGIYSTITDCANISKYAGGIGINAHNIRSKNSLIRGTNGSGDGLVPMLRVFNATARYVNQGGRRPGSIAVYLEPWHGDIMDFLDLRKNQGAEEERARDLFYGMWIPDLFMERVSQNAKWSLMCPDQCPGLSDAYGDEFTELYTRYEKEGRYIKQIDAHKVWYKILEAQIETGTPYMLYKDAVNKKSNQKNIGTIRSSNLCAEILEYTSSDEIATCNLASMCLPSYIDTNPETNEKYYNHEELHKAVKIVTKNLNKVIDRNFYPVEKARRSNLRHRPIGIGVSGLADTFFKLSLPFESAEAAQLNREIAETMYHAAVEASMELAKKRTDLYLELKNLESGYSDITKGIDITKTNVKLSYSLVMVECRITDIQYELNLNDWEIENLEDQYMGCYSSFMGSPASQGKLQFDLWDSEHKHPSTRYNWDELKNDVKTHGLRNSLLMAMMPTASTAQIMGFNEAFEPITSNMYSRSTKAGDFIQVNKYLVKDLMERNLWTEEIRKKIQMTQGILKDIPEIPDDLKKLYKTVWEIKQKTILNLAADRGAYICQTQSMNIFVAEPTKELLTTIHFYAWRKGLKTGMYYLRTKPKADTQMFTVDPTLTLNSKTTTDADETTNDEGCISCSA